MTSPVLVEVGGRVNLDLISAPDYDMPFQIGCPECFGTGWWAYGPAPEINGPCIECKNTGRVWVS